MSDDNDKKAQEEEDALKRRKRVRTLILGTLAASGAFQLNGWQAQAHGNRSSHSASALRSDLFLPQDYITFRQQLTAPTAEETLVLSRLSTRMTTLRSSPGMSRSKTSEMRTLQRQIDTIADKLRLRETSRQTLEFIQQGDMDAAVAVIEGEGDPERVSYEYLWTITDLAYSGSKGNQLTSEPLAALTALSKRAMQYVDGARTKFPSRDRTDMERAVHAALGGTFINCGQNCVASERILVHAGKAAWFEGRIASDVNAMRQGASEHGLMDVGAMITPLQLAHVEGLVARAVEEGARVVTGGKRQPGTNGWYYEPTVLADVRPDMEIMHEEMFGPVMLICPFDSDEDAVRIANDTAFGLSSSVFSRDGARAKRIADRVHAGMAAINDFGGMTYMAQELPFGGVKDSGFGRMNGAEGLRAFCTSKGVLVDRFPFGFPAKVFPTGTDDYDTTRNAVRLLYGASLGERAKALRDLIRKPR